MKKPKPRKSDQSVQPETTIGPVMVMARQTTAEIQRRHEIREALHDGRAKTFRKTR
jgi:hypothetical protein